MTLPPRRRRARRTATAAGTCALFAAVACTADSADNAESPTGGDDVVITFRLWDEVAAVAYQESFDAFNANNPGIRVDVEIVPWDSYWDRLESDRVSGDMPDIYWINSSNYDAHVDTGNIINIDDALGADRDEWVESVVELYTRDGSLWGVPQLWDSIALFYNQDLLDGADIDPDDLAWAPENNDEDDDGDSEDTLLDAATALTVDSGGLHPGEQGFNPDEREVYGFNAQVDLQAIYLNFLAQNGAQFQDPVTNAFAFDTPEGEEAFQYLVDMVNEHHVAPEATDTNEDPNHARRLFIDGELALFQSGPYSLRVIADNAEFNWGIAPIVAGPEGRMSVVHGVAALGNGATEHRDETVEVLRWLGSADGQTALATQGVAFPAATEAHDEFIEYWETEGVDISQFVEAAEGETTPAPVGPDVNAGTNEVTPILQDMFAGSIEVPEALEEAEEAGNAAMDLD